MKIIGLMGILAGAAIFVAACGAGDATPSPTAASNPTPTPTTRPAASNPTPTSTPTPVMPKQTATPVPTSPGPDDTVTTVPGAQDQTPGWLEDIIRRLENEPVANPPRSVVRYNYKGQTVYYLPPPCVTSSATSTTARATCWATPTAVSQDGETGSCPTSVRKAPTRN